MDMPLDRVFRDAMLAAEDCDFMAACAQPIHHFQTQHAITADMMGRVIIGKYYYLHGRPSIIECRQVINLL